MGAQASPRETTLTSSRTSLRTAGTRTSPRTAAELKWPRTVAGMRESWKEEGLNETGLNEERLMSWDLELVGPPLPLLGMRIRLSTGRSSNIVPNTSWGHLTASTAGFPHQAKL